MVLFRLTVVAVVGSLLTTGTLGLPRAHSEPQNRPCTPSPCGPNSECTIVGENHAACKCLPNHIGAPPNCKPECTDNLACSNQMACINQRCSDPCPGACGLNATCNTFNHRPICSCTDGLTGDAFTQCIPIPQEKPAEETKDHTRCVNISECPSHLACLNESCRDPCPGACGKDATCITINHSPVCSCAEGLAGDAFLQCIPIPQGKSVEVTKDSTRNPCPGACGRNAVCETVDHLPTCSCSAGQTGDPLLKCTPIPQDTSADSQHHTSCYPSPCGPNAMCKEDRHGLATCTCLPNYMGDPYKRCNPECVIDKDCPTQMACINQRCRDPCPGSCGANAACQTLEHIPTCTCTEGHTGDAFLKCTPISHDSPAPVARSQAYDPCNPSLCGPNAQCKTLNSNPTCKCLPSFIGAPPNCRPECVVSKDCPIQMACINQRCRDPCPGTCGVKAICQTVNHNPICSCSEGHTGDAFVQCTPVSKDGSTLEALKIVDPVPNDPCNPSPCGANTECKITNSSASCKCLTNYFGDAYVGCKPECVVSKDCSTQMACINQRCRDPCPGVCGTNAICQIDNHNPTCSCNEGHTGDAFVQCTPVTKDASTLEALTIVDPAPYDPCNPSPCGANAECKIINNSASCKCLTNYFGDAYVGCKPECVVSKDCSTQMACINQRCRDPCPGVCGTNAICQIVNHNPICSCSEGHTGDAFIQCSLFIHEAPTTVDRTLVNSQPYDPCYPSPCGVNAQCKIVSGHYATCKCLPNYAGNPYEECKPECVVNSDCPKQMGCLNQRCRDPCPGVCGTNATCATTNHIPTCTCSEGHAGDPYRECISTPQDAPIPAVARSQLYDPCTPSPCGPNAMCKTIENNPVCSCLHNYIGAPPNCRPECASNSECPTQMACINLRCSDPCPGACGLNANCNTVNYRPVCSCSEDHTGDPFVKCIPKSQDINVTAVSEPSVCKEHTDCPVHLACFNEICRDPCPGVCGINATCSTADHIPRCSCIMGQAGDPFYLCKPIPPRTPPPFIVTDPCIPFPCGPNARCNDGLCSNITEYVGVPYESCKPQCVLNADCPSHQACQRSKCVDPCPGSCGEKAKCNVENHIPICSCPDGFQGDPFSSCHLIIKKSPHSTIDPCTPSPCGPNSKCGIINGNPICSCQNGSLGIPPNCRQECASNTECPETMACVNQTCSNPCLGACGEKSACNVFRHRVICSCPIGYYGDPLKICKLIVKRAAHSIVDPCTPSPCGPNSQCGSVNNSPACSCLKGFVGRPPNCRHECTLHTECPQSYACVGQKCVDPCLGTCGEKARCNAVNHTAICSCPDGLTGDPFVNCKVAKRAALSFINPCDPSPCGPNSNCGTINNNPVCSCLKGFIGSPPSCRHECTLNTDCQQTKACVDHKCVDPCHGACGEGAHCEVINHGAICSCRQGQSGDPCHSCQDIPDAGSTSDNQSHHPCTPSPCGAHAVCKNVDNNPSCTCLPNYFGAPPYCRPECVSNEECPKNRACVNEKCSDPCLGLCELHSTCHTINHTPVCACKYGTVGYPIYECIPTPAVSTPAPVA